MTDLMAEIAADNNHAHFLQKLYQLIVFLLLLIRTKEYTMSVKKIFYKFC